MHKVAAIVMFGLIACGTHGPHVPTPFKGTTPVTLEEYASWAFCGFRMAPAGTVINSLSEDWLGGTAVEAGQTRHFSVKPGDYTVVVNDCTGGLQATRVQLSGSHP